MSISTNKLQKFVRQIQDAYDNESFIQEYLDHNEFDPSQHEGREYVQIGRRTNLPKKYFSEDEATMNQVIGTDFARTIARGEKRYVLSTVEEQADEDLVSQISVDEFNFETIVDAYGKVYDPDYLFLPNKTEYRQELFDWRNKGYIESDFHTIIIGQSKIEVNWIPTNLEINGGFLFNEESINIVQKQYQHADRPSEADFMTGKQWCSEDDLLMIYFGEEFRGCSDEFDFWIRSIISEPFLTSSRACHLEFN